MICNKCNREVEVGGWPFCPHEKASFGVIADDIPGGVWIRHGICNEDGTPRKYYSKSEMVKEAKARGLVNLVEHVPEHGSDKSRHTVRWVSVSPISEEDRLAHWWADEAKRGLPDTRHSVGAPLDVRIQTDEERPDISISSLEDHKDDL